jgi:protein subunit release factor A
MLSQKSREKLTKLQQEKKSLEEQLMQPEIASDPKKIRDVSVRLAEIREAVEAYSELVQYETSLHGSKRDADRPRNEGSGRRRDIGRGEKNR